ncbi:TonB-dependent receptor [Terrimonas sp. NA20]|uniref:TonB-dependent receptor n=1 Tax=Terrimonas ginsenosidimutans TaxID=2908004 RepID=A0ABS9KP42_9BACT|nr:outer membrane beta-barrel protein [Terrimonas ginsenosidimutans]MCG2614102.1 TonB-dependent receptor [Terrimonas ginsenosidimutans]
MRLLIILLLLTAISIVGEAQTAIIVKVLDSLETPVSKATVSLHKADTRTILKNSLTDSSGNAAFTGIVSGEYFISAASVGFLNASTGSFLIDTDQKKTVTRTVLLTRNVRELSGVTVTATKPLIEANEDRIAYNVELDLSLQGRSASEALAKLPFVSVDGNGGVYLKGQTSFQILLNGKQTSMFASNAGEVLKSFPANTISRIEVITNPSAKYEGEGLTGLINIITKKKVAGYNGHASFNYNTIGQVNPNASFNLKYGKLGITSFFYYARNLGFNTHGTQEYTALTNSSQFSRRYFADTGRHAGYNSGGNLELAYDIDSLQTISLYGRLSNGGNEPKQRSHIYTYDPAGTLIQQSYFETKENSDFPGGEIGFDYLRKLKKPGRSVSLNANRQFRKTIAIVNSDQYNSASDDRFLENISRAKNIQTTVQADYTVSFARRSKIEAGLRGIFREVSSAYISNVKKFHSDPYLSDPNNSNQLKYTQNVGGIYAVYTYSISEKKLMVKAGGRLEKTTVNGNFVSNNTKVEQDYYSFLPSISLNKTLKNGKRLSLAWNRRMARPGLGFLNPFRDNRDPLFITFGNERLRPEFANNIEVSVASFTQKITYSIAANASFVRSGIQRFITFDESTGISAQTYENIGQTDLFGLNGYLSYNISQKLSMTVSSNLNYAAIKNAAIKTEHRSGWYGSANASISYHLSGKTDLFSNINYSMAPVQLQGQNGDYLFYNIGSSYWIYKKKLMLSVALLNLFNKYWKTDNEFASASFRQQISTFRPMRAFSVGLRFNFGKLNETTSRKKGIAVDDTKQDIN